jgi:hypothetical protein
MLHPEDLDEKQKPVVIWGRRVELGKRLSIICMV